MTAAESFFWTGTTHLENLTCGFAVYVSFGQAFGTMNGRKMNVHGAGAQRSDPKDGDPAPWKGGNGPQGDEVRILNFARCVRGGTATLKTTGPAIENRFSPSRKLPEQGGPRVFVARLDRDGDGKVSREEFDGPPDHFDFLDKDMDGFLSEDEAPGIPPSGVRPGRGQR